jgi:hypothetical protein
MSGYSWVIENGATDPAAEVAAQKTFRACLDFMCMSRGQSHNLIVRYFVEQLIERTTICEQGSILIYNPATASLKLYDQFCTVLPALYDDGGFSGGTMERPALKRLIADIEAGQIDAVVVYKVDRLTRALRFC